LLDRVDPKALIPLLTPVYLAEVDHDLFLAASFEIDARSLPRDYPIILALFGQNLALPT
jgi:hypothetical protein